MLLCGAVMLSNGSPRHSAKKNGAAFRCTLKLHLPHTTLLYWNTGIMTPHISPVGGLIHD